MTSSSSSSSDLPSFESDPFFAYLLNEILEYLRPNCMYQLQQRYNITINGPDECADCQLEIDAYDFEPNKECWENLGVTDDFDDAMNWLISHPSDRVCVQFITDPVMSNDDVLVEYNEALRRVFVENTEADDNGYHQDLCDKFNIELSEGIQRRIDKRKRDEEVSSANKKKACPTATPTETLAANV